MPLHWYHKLWSQNERWLLNTGLPWHPSNERTPVFYGQFLITNVVSFHNRFDCTLPEQTYCTKHITLYFLRLKHSSIIYLILSISFIRSSSSRRKTLVMASRSASVKLFNSTSIFRVAYAEMKPSALHTKSIP